MMNSQARHAKAEGRAIGNDPGEGSHVTTLLQCHYKEDTGPGTALHRNSVAAKHGLRHSYGINRTSPSLHLTGAQRDRVVHMGPGTGPCVAANQGMKH